MKGFLVDDLIDNDENVASSKKYTQFTTRVQKPYPIYDQKGEYRYPIYDENHTLRGHTKLYSPYKGTYCGRRATSGFRCVLLD